MRMGTEVVVVTFSQNGNGSCFSRFHILKLYLPRRIQANITHWLRLNLEHDSALVFITAFTMTVSSGGEYMDWI